MAVFARTPPKRVYSYFRLHNVKIVKGKGDKMKITDRQYYVSVSEMPNYTNKQNYVSDLSLASIWYEEKPIGVDLAILTDNDIDEIVNFLNELWEIVNNGTKYIRSKIGLSQEKFSKRFLMSIATVKMWESNVNKYPISDMVHIGKITGLLPMTEQYNDNIEVSSEQFRTAIFEVKNYTNKQDYISNLTLFSMWYEEKPIGEKTVTHNDIDKIVNFLSEVWEVTHKGIKYIRSKIGLSQEKFSKKIFTSRRNVENWESPSKANRTQISLFMLIHIAQVCGVLPIEK